MNRIASFDTLRFFATIFIILSHIPNRFSGTYFHQSYLAVEFFFIISGFFLAKTYEESSKLFPAPIGNCRHYFINRFIRLWPAYIFALFLGFTFGDISTLLNSLGLNVIMLGGSGGIPSLLVMWYIPVLFWGGCFLYNLLVFNEEKAKCIYLPIISILCLFYLMNHDGIWGTSIPLDFKLINRGFIRGVLGLTVGIYTYWICRFITTKKEFLKKERLPRILLFWEILSVFSLLNALILKQEAKTYDFNIYFYIAFIVGILFFRKEKILKFLSWKVWQPFGEISYMLYLTHYIIIQIFMEHWNALFQSHLYLAYFVIPFISIIFAFLCYWIQKWLFMKFKNILGK